MLSQQRFRFSTEGNISRHFSAKDKPKVRLASCKYGDVNGSPSYHPVPAPPDQFAAKGWRMVRPLDSGFPRDGYSTKNHRL